MAGKRRSSEKKYQLVEVAEADGSFRYAFRLMEAIPDVSGVLAASRGGRYTFKTASVQDSWMRVGEALGRRMGDARRERQEGLSDRRDNEHVELDTIKA